MQPPTAADELQAIYNRYGQLNCTMVDIIRCVRKGDYAAAYREYVHDGDKLPRWTRYGRDFELFLNTLVGCRTHGVVGCQSWLCKRINTERID